MKIPWRAQAVAVIVSVFAGFSCSSTQPDRIETRTASVSFRTTAFVQIYECYDLQQDTNLDGIPDTDLGIRCTPRFESTGNPPLPLKGNRPVPWRYSIKITVIRAGTVDEEVITSLTGEVGSSVQPQDGVDDFISMTDYDTSVTPLPDRSEGDLYYLDVSEVSAGSPVYLSTIFVDPGIPNILQTTPTFDFTLNAGDTVIVRARKQPFAESPGYLPLNPDPRVQIVANLQISGVTVTPLSTPTGSPPTSTIEDKAGVTFSFTVR